MKILSNLDTNLGVIFIIFYNDRDGLFTCNLRRLF